MEKVYDFSKIINALRCDFNPYSVLGISSDAPDDVIIKMWNRYKDRKMAKEVNCAFEMLLIPVNRWVYDKLMEYVSQRGKEKIYDYALRTSDELEKYIACLEYDIVYETKKNFEETVKFGRYRLSSSDPGTGFKGIEHVARFTKNKEGFWFYSKDLRTEDAFAVVDIYKEGEKYIYFIKEHNWEYVIESRYLFIDFNKPTNFFGKFCRLSDVACRIKGNLLGLYTEMNNMDSDISMKHYYFKNKFGNVYEDGYGRDDSEFKVIDVKKRNVWVPESFIIDNSNKIMCYVQAYKDYYLGGNKVTKRDEEIILHDAEITNPYDVAELKKIIGRRLI